jgi:transposase
MKIIEMLRLAEQGFSQRHIAASVNCSKSTVGEIQRKCRTAGIGYGKAKDLTDEQLIGLLYPDGSGGRPIKGDPEWERIQQALDANRHVNLMYLWEEYRIREPEGLGYSQFCARYRKWRRQSGACVVMAREREPGKEFFVDWMGDTPSLVLDDETGKMLKAHFFVGTLGDSGYPVVEAFPDERMQSWITAHVHAFTALGGLPLIVVPDNCKTAVCRPNYYDPAINKAYRDLAAYYNIAVIPARIRSPRDKAQVEGTVGWLETHLVPWIQQRGPFHSFNELNHAVKQRMAELTARPFQKRAGSRERVFLEVDKPLLRPLPPQPYEAAEWQSRRVPDNYHLEYAGFYYSVPHSYYKQTVDLRITHSLIEVFQGMQRIAVHERRYAGKRYVTLRSHMPENHQFMQDQNRFDGTRYRSWARFIGEHTFRLIDSLLTRTDIEETSYRSCMGVLQFSKQYGNERLEAACRRARELHSCSYTTVYNILKNNQERGRILSEVQPTPAHANIRGPAAFR